MEEKHLLICPVCESKNWLKVYNIGAWSIDRCPACAFAKVDPLPQAESRPQFYSKEQVVERNLKKNSPSRAFSRNAKRFFNRLAKRNKSEIFYKKLCKYILPGAKILDVGCGDGSFLRIARENFDCTGIEISEYLAGLAKKDGGIKVQCANFSEADMGAQKYDALTMISLLEHLDDPLKALTKCFNLLNEGGVLLLKTVNYACLNRVIKKEKWTGLRPPDHVVYFSPANLAKLLKKIGFRRIKISAWPFNDNMYCDAFK